MTHAEELQIDGLVNVRDLGGVPTRDGRTVRSRQVIRSDNPRALTAQGQQDLADVVAPALIVDLRMQMEVHREGYTVLHDPVQIVNLEMIPQSGITPEQIADGLADNLVDDYLRQLEVNAASIIGALRLIADPGNRPAVVHCTAGKDRTGIVVAMLLSLLGVTDDVIVRDYEATAPNMGLVIERVRSAPVYQETGLAAAEDWIFAADPETMRGFLAGMADRYGDAESWALNHGLTTAEIESLRATLLT